MPIYNKEKYINKSIKSLQNQTLKDIEIIAVNDCSDDKSLNELINLSKNDNRIKIVNNDRNHGLLYSRAMGILNSTGEYLMNLDPDDELEGEDNLEYLYNMTRISHAEIITFGMSKKKFHKTFINPACPKKTKVQKQPQLFNSIFNKYDSINDYLITNKLIKREIFLKAYNEFKDEIYNGKWNYHEDNIWSILVNRYAKSKICINKLIYIYNYHNDSLMNKDRLSLIELENLLYRHNMYKKLFKSKNYEKYLIREYLYLLNLLNTGKKKIALLNNTKIKSLIVNYFSFFLANYNCSINQTKDIISFLGNIIL